MNVRNQLWIVTFLGFWVNYMLRININIAIVYMVLSRDEGGNINQTTEKILQNTKSSNAKYDWDTAQQSMILGGYFMLHWLTQIPGGYLSHHYGTKLVVLISNIICTILTFITPLAASKGYRALVCLRIILGLASGVFWPAMHDMVSKWIPPKERGAFISSYLGSSVGAAFTYLMCGYIMEYSVWENVFYATGVLGIFWLFLWIVVMYDTPVQHPRIADKEREHIEASLGDTLSKNKLSIPWMEMLTSPAVWVNAFAQWGASGALLGMITITPTYLKRILRLDIQKTGLWSGLPHLTRWLFSIAFGFVTSYQTSLSVTNLRKLATALCTIGVAILMYGLAFTTRVDIALALLLISVTLQGTIPAGPIVSVIDMSPNFSAILQGLSGMLSTSSGFLYPVLEGYLTKDNETFEQWRKFYIIMATITFLTGALYTCFGTSEVQSWNVGKRAMEKEIQPLQQGQV